jgi:NAD(P)-dependent dehydrogenase (short-subunit alcohol dehydrogenase family)
MQSFENKVAAITGAASGIGRGLALELAARGCDLALSDLNDAGLAETAREAEMRGAKVTTRNVDVADREAVHAWADDTAADHGQVNLIFNNAGVALVCTVENAQYEDLEWLMNINYWGVVYGTKAFLPHLKASGDGHIVNISSVFGLMGVPSQSAYNAAKFAVRGFTECLRQELDLMDCGVSATCVHPGGIKTNIARAARRGGTVTPLGMVDTDDEGEFEKLARTTPEQAANIILRAVLQNRRRIMVGNDAVLIDAITRIFGAGYQRYLPGFFRKANLDAVKKRGEIEGG